MATLSDDFNRADSASLGANWTEVIDGADIVTNACNLTGASSLNTHNTTCTGVNQYFKLSWSGGANGDLHIPWAIFRYSTAFYSVRFDVNANTISWYSHTSSADTAGTLIGTTAATVDLTDTWGCTITGTGNGTEVRAWKSPTGAAPDSDTSWGGDTSPDVTLTDNPGTAVDSGSKVGFGHTTANPFAQTVDNWSGGDTPSGIVLPTARARFSLAQMIDWKPQRWDFPLGVDLLLDDYLPAAAGGGTTVSVPLGTLTLTAFAPAVVNPKSVSVPLGTLTLTGFAPAVTTTADVLVSVPLGTLNLAGFAPTVRTPRLVAVPLASLPLVAFAPDVNVSSGADVTVLVPLATLPLTAFAPTILTPRTIAVPPGTLTLAGFAPAVAVSADVLVAIPLATLILSGFAPAVVVSGAPAANDGYPIIEWRRRRPR